MTIVFAIIAALALIGLGVAVMFYRRERLAHNFLKEDYEELQSKKAALEREIKVLRESNRSSLKVWQSERRRISAQARDAERHALELQEFHLAHEHVLQNELLGAHAMIEVLLATYPKDYSITPIPHEIKRVFRPIVAMNNLTDFLKVSNESVF